MISTRQYLLFFPFWVGKGATFPRYLTHRFQFRILVILHCVRLALSELTKKSKKACVRMSRPMMRMDGCTLPQTLTLPLPPSLVTVGLILEDDGCDRFDGSM
ncbi:hypothetical protein TNCT_330271 [Trichonephila clavata]|uniref:Uncharacterized protein n=1 Tax=Trichonephila clavata TaxID=2740835 RepID=A0A8X6GX59_TRICU|nr:hypothetical protein TNCT_330271 [Trichonephila clavata]